MIPSNHLSSFYFHCSIAAVVYPALRFTIRHSIFMIGGSNPSCHVIRMRDT